MLLRLKAVLLMAFLWACTYALLGPIVMAIIWPFIGGDDVCVTPPGGPSSCNPYGLIWKQLGVFGIHGYITGAIFALVVMYRNRGREFGAIRSGEIVFSGAIAGCVPLLPFVIWGAMQGGTFRTADAVVLAAILTALSLAASLVAAVLFQVARRAPEVA